MSRVQIGSENVVNGVFAPGCHVAWEDVHHTFGNLKFAFLACVFAPSSGRVDNLQLERNNRKLAECVKSNAENRRI